MKYLMQRLSLFCDNLRERATFLNEAIYVLKFWLVEQSELNQDSLLNQFLKLRFICTYQIDLSINFRSIHSHSEVIVEFSVVFVAVSAIRVYNDIINFLKKNQNLSIRNHVQ